MGRSNFQIIVRKSEEVSELFDVILMNHSRKQVCMIDQCEQSIALSKASELAKLVGGDVLDKTTPSRDDIIEDDGSDYNPNLSADLFEE